MMISRQTVLNGYRDWATGMAAVAVFVLCAACGSETPEESATAPEAAPAAPAEGTAPAPASSETASAAAASGKPNIVWVLLDAARSENMSTFGYDRETTPHLSELAKDGAVFERCYSQANGTTLSVPSYLTGKYFPVVCLSSGSWRNLYRTPPDDEKLFTEIVSANGYHSAMFTAHPWLAVGSRLFETFDEGYFLPATRNPAYAEFDEINEAAFEWLDNAPEEPFFLYLHTMDTHLPHYAMEGHDQWIDKEYAANQDDSTPYSDKHKEYLIALYDGSFHYADHEIGRLADKLKEKGLYENTIFVISSDHGDCMGEDGVTMDHPGNLTVEQLFHVPLVIAGPGIPANSRVAALTQNVDIVPTLIDLAGMETGAKMDGKSLMPLLEEGGPESLHDYVVARFPQANDNFLEWITIRDDEHRFEYRPQAGGSVLWKTPDNLGARQDVTAQNPEAVAAATAAIDRELMPLWEQYAALPHTSPRPFPLEISPLFASPPGAFTDAFVMDDNLWACLYLNLISTAMHEDSPPISFSFEVPNGTYRVQMELMPKDTGSAFQVTAEDDTEPKLVVSEEVQKTRAFVDLGTYDITDGSFDVTLDEGNTTNSARMSTFRLIPIVDGEEVSSSEAQEEMNEQLDALGYL